MALGVGAVDAQQKQPIRVGVIQPLSGPIAAAGSYIANGAKIAADKINAKGGVLGRPIELIIEDNKSDPAETRNAAEKLLVRDKVPVLMGAWGSSMTLAAMPLLTKYGVPMLVETSSSIKITDPKTPGAEWVSRISPSSEIEAMGVAPIIPKLGMKRVGYIAVNTDWGRGAVTAFGDPIKKSGGNIEAVEYVGQADTDFYSQLTKFKAAGLDSVIVTDDAPKLAKMLVQMRDLGYRPKVMSTGGSSFPDGLIQIAGGPEPVNGSYHIMLWNPYDHKVAGDPELSKYFVDEWKKRNLPWIGVVEGMRGFDGIHVIAKAIENAGEPEPKKIHQAMRKLDMKGLYGRIKFDKNGQSYCNILLTQVQDGKIVTVAVTPGDQIRPKE
jgi:branched-chain amino acid transport system substrate-binding protein